MIIAATYFDHPTHPEAYKRILDVYEHSCKKHNPNATVKIDKIDTPTFKDNIPLVVDNLHKLRYWVKLLTSVEEGVLITDCDMFFTGSIEHVFNKDFDIAYTKRTNYDKKYYNIFYKPINGGVFFFKPTEKARAFVRRWLEVCEQMLEDDSFYKEWFTRYAGFNQTALGYLLETDKTTNMLELPCSVYNGCGEDLVDFKNHKPLLCHVKTPLWKYCTNKTEESDEDSDGYVKADYKDMIKYWKDLEGKVNE